MGSKFSIPQTITPLPSLSLITSSSNSFHPYIDSSIKTSWVGEALNASDNFDLKSSSLFTTLVPPPPRMNDGLSINGKPISLLAFIPSSKDLA